MSLLGNGYRHSSIGKLFGATSLDGANPSVHEYRRKMGNRMRNQFAGEGITSNVASVPSGTRPPVAWIMARKNGAMSSRNNAGFSFTPTANGTMGYPISGSTSFSFSFAPADGQLISSGTGTASFSITTTGNVLATLSTTGTASFSISTNTPLLGATGWVEGNAAYSMGATLVSYGKGFMVGSTVDSGTLTAPLIAAEVWNSIAASYNTAGTMGQKLNSAASGGVDYAALGMAVWDVLLADADTPGSMGELVQTGTGGSGGGLTLAQFLALK